MATILNASTSEDWWIYENYSYEASITQHEGYVELNGNGLEDGFALGDWENKPNAWNNTSKTQITWRMKYNEPFKIYIRVMTKHGPKYLFYTADDNSYGSENGEGIGHYIHHGLGSNAVDGTWNTYTRDLEADIKKFDSMNELLAVNAFLVRGSGSIDIMPLKVLQRHFNNHTYYTYNGEKNWTETENFCREKGLGVLTITSQEENDFIAKWIQNLPSQAYWLAGTDEGDEGTWQWLNNETWNYENWADNEPNNSGSRENQLEIFAHSNNNQWNDVPTIEYNGIICETLVAPANTSPLNIGQYSTMAYDILVSNDGKTAYVATGEEGIKILDITSPYEPRLSRKSQNYPIYNIDISRDNSKLFGLGKNGLKIFNIISPQLVLLGEYPMSHEDIHFTWDILLSNDSSKAFILVGDNLDIIDVRNPYKPTLIKRYPVGLSPNMTLSNDSSKLFVASDENGFKIIDVSNPLEASLISTYLGDGFKFTWDIQLLKDNYEAVIANYGSLENINIQNFEDIKKLGEYRSDSGPHKVILSKDNTKAFFVNEYNGLEVLDISDLAHPVKIAEFSDGGGINSIALSPDETKAYLATRDNGVQVIDLYFDLGDY